MCIACAEFIKSKLTVQEFRRALAETTRENPEHFREVEQVFKNSSGETDEQLREKLKKKTAKP